MTDEIEPNEFHRVFASLDDDDATAPPYADRLWAELETTLNRERLAPEPGDTVVVELDSAPSRQRDVSRRWVGVRIAAASAAAALAIVAVSDRNSTPVETIGEPPTIVSTTTVPVLTDPVAACARYFDDEWSIDRVVASDLTTADFDAALDAIDRLRVDLEASVEFTPGDLTRISIARGSVLQAKLEVAEGLLDRAKASLRGVADQIALYDDLNGEARCVPADE